jgi:competence protein ComEC
LIVIKEFFTKNLLKEHVQYPVWIPVIFGLGVSLGYYLTFWSFFAIISISIIIAIILRNNNIIYILLIVVLGNFSFAVKTYNNRTNLLNHEVITYIKGNITEIIPADYGYKIALNNVRSKKYPNLSKKVKLTVRTKLNGAKIGDLISVLAKLYQLPDAVIPSGYSYMEKASYEGIGELGFSLGGFEIRENGKNSFSNYINNLRLKIGQRILEVAGAGVGHIISALTIGEYSGINRGLLNNIRASGLAHLLAVSGMHVSLVAGICFLFIRSLICFVPNIALRYDSKKIAALFTIIGTLIYLFISGAKVAAIRAFIMCLFFLAALLLDRNITPIRSVAFAALAILIVQPEVLFSPSFQMSFAAVVGLISCYQIISKKLSFAFFYRNIFTKFLFYFMGIIISSFIAGFATMPYSMYHFNQIANYGIIANLVAIPITSFLLMPLVVINFILFPFGLDYYSLKLTAMATKPIIFIANYTSSLSYALISPPHMSAIVIAMITLGGLWFLIWQERWRYLGIIPIILAIFIMKYQKLPDIMIDAQKFGYVIYSNDKLYMGNKIPKYTKDNWQRYFGVQQIHKISESDLLCDENICKVDVNGKKIVIINKVVSSKYCYDSDLIINLSDKNIDCPNNIRVINKDYLRDKGNIAIYVRDTIKIDSVKDSYEKIF